MEKLGSFQDVFASMWIKDGKTNNITGMCVEHKSLDCFSRLKRRSGKLEWAVLG